MSAVMLGLFAVLATAPPGTSTSASAPDASTTPPSHGVVDTGRIVSERQIVWAPKRGSDDVRNGFLYEFVRDDGSHQKIAQIDGDDLPKGTRIYVVEGQPLRVVKADTYETEARAALAAGPAPAGKAVVVRGRRAVSVTEARQHATGKDWNKVYCETAPTLGSLIPRQTCLTLADWDTRHREAEDLRTFMFQFANPGPVSGGG